MKNKDRNINYKAFIPIGIIFIGTGLTFMLAVNPMIGVGLIGVGIAFLISGTKHNQDDVS